MGCGDVGRRVAGLLNPSSRVLALTSSVQRMAELQSKGITPLLGNLDEPHSLQRLAGVATHLVHMAPPPLQGDTDPRTRHLVQALAKRTAPLSVVYGSTSGVYGDCEGAWIDETRAVNPTTPRAQRRVDAENWLQSWGQRGLPRVYTLSLHELFD